MPNKFASGKYAISQCDRCNFRYKLAELRIQTLKTKPYKIKVCKTCWDPDHPQLQLGMYPVNDPQAVREPRPDISYFAGGNTGLYTSQTSSLSTANAGVPTDGSRQTQWSWNPVGGARFFTDAFVPNDLNLAITIGNVTITTS